MGSSLMNMLGNSQVNTANRSPTLKEYWAKCKPLAVRDGILEHHLESIDR
jgi:hypothetical protein